MPHDFSAIREDAFPPAILSAKQPAIGIDLGTTYSAIAQLDAAGRPQTISNAEGDKLTPSVVFFDEDAVIVGKEALKAIGTHARDVARCMKRELGHRYFGRELGGRHFPPEALQAWVLDKLRRDAARVVGDVRQAVVTVPAYFDEVRRCRIYRGPGSDRYPERTDGGSDRLWIRSGLPA
jgi:molecular chaperone DnaK